jgi:hypothetical protein
MSVLPQVLRPGGGHRDERIASRRVMTGDEASVVGVFPHGEMRHDVRHASITSA